jgi:hypothetical protein
LHGLGRFIRRFHTATPYFQNGAIRFKEVVVDSKKDGFYIRRVRAALASTLRNQFGYKVAEDARRSWKRSAGITARN